MPGSSERPILFRETLVFRIRSWKPAMLGEVFPILLVVVSLSASLITPKNPGLANINLRF